MAGGSGGRQAGSRSLTTRRFRVVPSSAAARDLVRAHEWLTQPGSGQAARRILVAIGGAIKGLRLDHHRWPDSVHNGVRERRVQGYTILYRTDVASRTVNILRIFGPFQDRSTL